MQIRTLLRTTSEINGGIILQRETNVQHVEGSLGPDFAYLRAER